MEKYKMKKRFQKKNMTKNVKQTDNPFLQKLHGEQNPTPWKINILNLLINHE